MEELKEKVIKRLENENKSTDIDNIFEALKEELKDIAKENGNDATFGSIIRKLIIN